jgi:hypothetical protein
MKLKESLISFLKHYQPLPGKPYPVLSETSKDKVLQQHHFSANAND